MNEYKRIEPGDDIFVTETELKEQALLRKRTMEEQQQEVLRGRSQQNKTTLVIRNVKSNPDLVWLLIAIGATFCAGFWIAKIADPYLVVFAVFILATNVLGYKLAKAKLGKKTWLIITFVLIFATMGSAFCLVRLKYGVDTKIIEQGIWDFVKIVGALITAYFSILGKLHSKPGPITEYFQRIGNKESVDIYQRSIPPTSRK